MNGKFTNILKTNKLEQNLINALEGNGFSKADFPELSHETITILNERLAPTNITTERLYAIVNVLVNFSQLDFSQLAPVSNKSDEIDAIAHGLNTLAEEIQFYRNQLEANNHNLELAQRMGGIGSWIYYENSKKAKLSETLLQIYQHPEAHFHDFTTFLKKVVHPDDVHLIIATIRRARKDQSQFTVQHRAIRPDGATIYLESRGEMILENEKIIGIQGSTLEITNMVVQQHELKKVSDLLYEKQQMLENAQRIGGIGSWYWDIKSNIIDWSKTLYDIFEIPYDKPIPRPFFQSFIIDEDVERVNKAVEDCVNTGHPLSVVYRIISANKRMVWLEVKGERITKSGKVVALQGTALNVTEQVINRQKLQELANSLEQKVKERTEDLETFSYSVSHDLRAPLRAIKGFSQILNEEFSDALPKEAQRLLEIIRRNSIKMSTLIDELLTFSRINKLQPNFTSIDLNYLINKVWKEFSDNNQTADNHKIIIQELPKILGNEALLHQVFNNILNNAVKYSAKVQNPQISISSFNKEKEVIIEITDNGAGFDMKLQDKLFNVFQRLHSDDEFTGIGVGLAMAKRILDKHQARIWARSEKGKGASFYIAFPNL